MKHKPKEELNILYKIASRSRPSRLNDTIASICVNSNSSNKAILVSWDEDDETMQEWAKNSFNFLDVSVQKGRFIHVKGKSQNKIDAINRDINLITKDIFDWDILVNISDDMVITSPEFESAVRDAFALTTDMFLHLPDGYANMALATMSVMGREYYERFGYIYHPSYESVYCDNEAMDVAKALHKYAYVNRSVFVHLHPANIGNSVNDAQYEKTEAKDVHERDRQNYEKRKAAKFPTRFEPNGKGTFIMAIFGNQAEEKADSKKPQINFTEEKPEVVFEHEPKWERAEFPPKLSVLICTIPEREESFNALKMQLLYQQKWNDYNEQLEIISDNRIGVSTGTKRQALLEKATGDFVVFIDDDDEIHYNYLNLIIETLYIHPDVDCVGINGHITFAGENKREWSISKDYGSWYEKDGKYFRTPNHISPVRRSIALKVGFHNLMTGEDFKYSMGILPYLEKEAKITPPIYHYKYSQPIHTSSFVAEKGSIIERKPWR